MKYAYQLGFLGAGNMAEAIARAALDAGVVPAWQMIAYDPTDARRELFASLGLALAPSNAQVIAQSQYVLLAVKPQTLPQLVSELAEHVTGEQILVSIMAGISTRKISQAIAAAGGPPQVRVVRVMPNTPLMVGAGMAGIAMGEGAKEGDDELALKLFSAAGKAIRVPESALDAVTAVSGSGPAYVFYLAEAMERAAAELGLTDDARLLVGQTILGAAQLLVQSGEAPAELRRKVTSPGGTTEAAIKHLDGNATRDVVVNAIKAAQRRSLELGA